MNDNSNSTLTDTSVKTILQWMMGSRRWMLWAEEENPKDPDKPKKVPYYANGKKRHGTLDTPGDIAQLVSYDEADKVLVDYNPKYETLGFALGPDGNGGYWQGIDLDDITQNELDPIAWDCPGYKELSPSGKGIHAIGYGREFKNFNDSDKTGIEAYCKGRYFTYTGDDPYNIIKNPPLVCLADFVEQILLPRVNENRNNVLNFEAPPSIITDQTKAELRSALTAIDSCPRDTWVNVGMALKGLGLVGRSLWFEWSQSCPEKWEPKEAVKQWDSFKPKDIDYQTVFHYAQQNGWVNPRSNAAQLPVGGNLMQFQNNRQGSGYAGRFEQGSGEVDEPRHIFANHIAPQFELCDVPQNIWVFADHISNATGFNRDGLIHAGIGAISAVIADSLQLTVTDTWAQSVRFWNVNIQNSGENKTQSLKIMSAPVEKIHRLRLKIWWRICSNLDSKEEKPPRPALLSNNATLAGIREKLIGNRRGIVLLTDEFASWIGSIESMDSRKQDRAEWLKLKDGGFHEIDRSGGGVKSVANWSASILTCTSSDGLRESLKHGPSEDGLLQRFLPCIVGDLDETAILKNIGGVHLSAVGTKCRYGEAATCLGSPSRSRLPARLCRVVRLVSR